jgi:hypothetical protein
MTWAKGEYLDILIAWTQRWGHASDRRSVETSIAHELQQAQKKMLHEKPELAAEDELIKVRAMALSCTFLHGYNM